MLKRMYNWITQIFSSSNSNDLDKTVELWRIIIVIFLYVCTRK